MARLFLFCAMCIGYSCKQEERPPAEFVWYGEEVLATAYNSVPWQTQGNPNITAWGDTLKAGLKSIAVSRDLIQMGLKHNTMVRIDTFPDTFIVKDKMHRRWRKRIDIYMGDDVKKAREWGKRRLMICYALPLGDSLKSSKK